MSKPDGVKAPQDHKKKAAYEEVEVTLGEGEDARTIPARRVTVQGLTLTVEERRLNDYRVTRMMAKARKGDMLSNIDLLDFLLADQHEQVVETCADDDGFTSQEAVGEFVKNLFEALAPNS